jgi:fibronectin-binding autotransporter adhesin
VKFHHLATALPATFLLLVSAPTARAGGHTWSGAGINDLWSNPANWSSGGVPSAAESHPLTLVFPDDATSKTPIDNIPSLVVDVLTINGVGYNLGGLNAASLTFTGVRGYNLISTGTNTGANQINSSLPLVLSATIDVLTGGSQTLKIASVISGAGGLSVYGQIDLSGTAANTFTGATTIYQDGRLYLEKSAGKNAFAGPLDAEAGGYVESLEDNQVPDSVLITLRGGAQFVPGIHAETVGPLKFDDGTIRSYGATALTLAGDVTAVGLGGTILNYCSLGGGIRTFDVAEGTSLNLNADIINGNGGAGGITKTGLGSLRLNGANSFNGVVTISAGECQVGSDTALGSTTGGTVVAAGATLDIQTPRNIQNEPLLLAGRFLYQSQVFWSGPVALSGVASSFEGTAYLTNVYSLSLSGVISGTGKLTKTNSGRLDLIGAAGNTYTGGTLFEEGEVYLGKTSGDAVPGNLDISTAMVALFANEQIANTATVTLKNGTLDLGSRTETIGALSGSDPAGNIKIALGSLVIGQNDASTSFAGLISGNATNPLVKHGLGTLTLAHPTGNTVTGKMLINGGALQVDDSEACSVTVNPGGLIKGSGAVAGILLHGGKVDLDALTSSSLSSDVAGSQAITHLNGPGAGEHGMMKINGGVDLTGITLSAVLGYSPYNGTTYTLIDNDGSDAFAGPFAGLPEGQSLMIGSKAFTVTYQGGSGNDLVLTLASGGMKLPVIIQFTTAAVAGSSPPQILLTVHAESEPGAVHQLQASGDLISWSDVGGWIGTDGGGGINFSIQEPAYDRRFYRLLVK